jgi:hypothetical protein
MSGRFGPVTKEIFAKNLSVVAERDSTLRFRTKEDQRQEIIN